MDKVFTREFLKFLFGFVGLVLVTLLLLYFLQDQANSSASPTDAMQALPATTTQQQ
jgi:uncharacterized membrane protein YfcA